MKTPTLPQEIGMGRLITFVVAAMGTMDVVQLLLLKVGEFCRFVQHWWTTF